MKIGQSTRPVGPSSRKVKSVTLDPHGFPVIARKKRIPMKMSTMDLELSADWMRSVYPRRCLTNQACFVIETDCAVKDFADLMIQCRMNLEVIAELARLVSAILARRKGLYHCWLARDSYNFPSPNTLTFVRTFKVGTT